MTPEPKAKHWTLIVDEYSEWVSSRVVRTAELMLITAAFAYAAVRTDNPAVMVFAVILGLIAVIYLINSFAGAMMRVARRAKRAKRGWMRWALFLIYGALVVGIVTVSMISFLVVFLALSTCQLNNDHAESSILVPSRTMPKHC
jgi:uncharacterized membrane protein YhaH (DUF805 family)